MLLALARLLLGERPSALLWILSAVAGGAGWILNGASTSLPPRAIALALAMALTFTLYVVMTRSLRTETTRANLFYTALGVLVALSPVMLSQWVAPLPRDLGLMAAIGLIGFFALYALDRMAATAPVALTAPALSVQAFAAGAIGWGRAHEFPGRRLPAALAAIALIVMIGWLRNGTLVSGEPA
jgi:drug/metabolite transporter (DMT)-like permease